MDRPGQHDNLQLWQLLSSYQVGPADAEFGFTDRLARENGWDRTYADRVVEEYRRFCFLAMRAGHPVTPSDAVDQAWHLHLTYSRDYWDRFCPEILGGPLHHGPSAGGQAERDRYFRQYADTLASYERIFGPSPADIWPAAQKRLYRDPQARRVRTRDYFLIPKRAALFVTLLAICAAILVFILW